MANTDPRARLLQLASDQGASLSGLSEMIGRNSTYLQQFIRKGSPRKLEETDRRTLARFFGVDEADLGAPEEISSDFSDSAGPGQWCDVPRFALDASAGPGAVPAEEQAIGAFRFSARWLREQGLDPKTLSAIAVAGDSMEPTLRDGDEILVDRRVTPLRDGIHILLVDDTLLVKRLGTGRPGKLILISDNPAYSAIELSAGEVQVLGRVVWKSGRI